MAQRNCKNCGSAIPNFVWVDGKKRNCQRRKYCLDCSPFGSHNTRKIEKSVGVDDKGRPIKSCPDCKELHTQRGARCFKCYFKSRKKKKQEDISDYLGGFKCWICGYDSCKRNVCFHHVDPTSKTFSLTTRELMLRQDRVFSEMKKCILVCCNCHGEIHEGLISQGNVEKIWLGKWSTLGPYLKGKGLCS